MKRVQIGSGSRVEDATIGHAFEEHQVPTVIGSDATVRCGTIIYADVEIGDRFTTGHNALVRERTRVGDDVLVGTNVTIDGRTTIGSNVSLQTAVYVPAETTIGDDVFVGPAAVMTNDPYPVRTDTDLVGPTLENDVSVGANATILPGVTIGEGSFVAAGALVTEDVPPRTLAIGSPAQHRELPPHLDGRNQLA